MSLFSDGANYTGNLWLPKKPIVLDKEHWPVPYMSVDTENRIAREVFGLLERKGDSSVSCTALKLGATILTACNAAAMYGSEVIAPPIEPSIVYDGRQVLFAPNGEGQIGDISAQEGMQPYESPVLASGRDYDILVIAQRLLDGGYAATAAVVNSNSENDRSGMQYRFGAY